MSQPADKLDLLRSLLKENPELSMKEANVTIREQFGTGVAPPQYSKIKKEFEGGEPQQVKAAVKKTKPKKDTVKESSEESSSESENDLESFFDGSAAKEVQAQETPAEESGESENEGLLPESEEVDAEPEEEEEDLTPVPTFPVTLEVHIPEAETVHLAGSFNKWKTEQYPLQKKGPQTWVFNDELPEGEHFYKFIVDSKLWHLDMDKEYFVDSTGISHKITVSAD